MASACSRSISNCHVLAVQLAQRDASQSLRNRNYVMKLRSFGLPYAPAAPTMAQP